MDLNVLNVKDGSVIKMKYKKLKLSDKPDANLGDEYLSEGGK